MRPRHDESYNHSTEFQRAPHSRDVDRLLNHRRLREHDRLLRSLGFLPAILVGGRRCRRGDLVERFLFASIQMRLSIGKHGVRDVAGDAPNHFVAGRPESAGSVTNVCPLSCYRSFTPISCGTLALDWLLERP